MGRTIAFQGRRFGGLPELLRRSSGRQRTGTGGMNAEALP